MDDDKTQGGGSYGIHTTNSEDYQRMQQLIDLAKNGEHLSEDEQRARLRKIDPDLKLTHKALDQITAQRNADKGRPAGDVTDRVIDITGSPLPSVAKKALLDEFDPDRSISHATIKRLEREIPPLIESQAKRTALVDSMQKHYPWIDRPDLYRLQKNDCSRLHKLDEAMSTGMFWSGDEEDEKGKGMFMWKGSTPTGHALDSAKAFVVRHDWAAAIGLNFDPKDPFRLPAPICAFEFRINDTTVVMTMRERPDRVETTLVFEGVGGLWLAYKVGVTNAMENYLEAQIRAICIALEAQVATHDVVRAPSKLNEKRAKNGKPALRDFHIVDLSKRTRAASRPEAGPTGRRVRLHFRRGHWRHFDDHKTWIEWMLVGDPDLGFIDKNYRI